MSKSSLNKCIICKSKICDCKKKIDDEKVEIVGSWQQHLNNNKTLIERLIDDKKEVDAKNMYTVYKTEVDNKSFDGSPLQEVDIFFSDIKYEKQANAWRKVSELYYNKIIKESERVKESEKEEIEEIEESEESDDSNETSEESCGDSTIIGLLKISDRIDNIIKRLISERLEEYDGDEDGDEE